jgi:ATP-binding cassette subfamily C protein
MLLIIKFARFYPRQSLLTLLFLILAGIVEGIGMTALLPLLQTAINPADVGNAAGSAKSTFISSALASVGIPMTVGSLLTVMLCGAIVSSALILIADRYIGYTVSHVATDLRLALLRALLSTRWGHFLKQQVGSMANAAGTEAMRASTAYLHAATAIAMTIQAFAYFMVALLVSWKITLCFMTAGSFVVLLLSRMVRQAKKAGRKQTQLLQ